MVDTNYKKIEEGMQAIAFVHNHRLQVEIYEIENEKVYFRTIKPKSGEPSDGKFNRIESSRYLTLI